MLPCDRITVIGIGRLGLCLSLCLERAGYEVLGLDILPNYVSEINAKTLRSPEPRVTEFLRNSLHFTATTSLEEGLAFSNLIFIALPCSARGDGCIYQSSSLLSLFESIDKLAPANKHFAISTAVSPGTISTIRLPSCQGASVSYNPLFTAQGTLIKDLMEPDLILIGEGSPAAGFALETVYRTLCGNPTIARMSPESAEITKLAINSFVSMKIAFANLLGEVAEEAGCPDKEAILEAMGKDRRVGSENLQIGYGYGGPSIPRDNLALSQYVSSIGLDPSLLEATNRTNERHAEWIADQFLKKDLAEYIFEDVCYKPNCPHPITENSPKLAVATKIAHQGKRVVILDSEGVICKVQQEYPNLFDYTYKDR